MFHPSAAGGRPFDVGFGCSVVLDKKEPFEGRGGCRVPSVVRADSPERRHGIGDLVEVAEGNHVAEVALPDDWGIDLNGVRNTALRDLARQLNPTALADSLGYSSQIIHQHAAAAAAPMSDYIDLKASQLRSSPEPNTREE